MTLPFFTRRSSSHSRLESRRRRPLLESLESRMVLSAAMGAPVQHVAAHVALHTQASAHPHVSVAVPLSLSNINLTNITSGLTSGATSAANGVLTATGTVTGQLLGQTFTTPVTATLTPASTATGVPILHLELNPIHLNVLGVKVDTSRICLNVTAHPGSGNLLGNLLGGLSNVLNSATGGTTTGGTTTGGTTTGGTTTTSLLSSLNSILNQPQLLAGLNNILARETSHAGSPTTTAQSTAGTTTQILNLSIAPVDLNVLGLEVKLDNCANGPVTVDISAVQGPGNLLGNLLTSVAHLLDRPGNPVGAITAKLNQILTRIEHA